MNIVEVPAHYILKLLLIIRVEMNGKRCATSAGALGLIFNMRNVCHLNLTISVKFAEREKIYLSQRSNFRQGCWLEINTKGNG